MSFRNNNVWMPRDPAFLSDGERGLGTSPDTNPKRQPLWDASGQELFSSRKKQAVGSIDDRPIPPSSNANNFLWDNGSRSQSTSNQFNERLLVSESFRTFDPADKSISSAGDRSLNIENLGSFKRFGNESSVNLSMSHALEDPSRLNNGIGRANINEFVNSENSFNVLMGHGHGSSYITGDNGELALSTDCDGNLISNVTVLRKNADEFVQPGHHSLPYNTEHENFVMSAPSFGKNAETFKGVNPTFVKWDALTTSLLSNRKDDVTPFSTGVGYDPGSSSILSMNQSHDAGGTIISFGLEAAKDTTQGVGLLTQPWTTQDTDSPAHNVNQAPNVIPSGGKMAAASNKTKEGVKPPVNNFPSNVKSLLTTGILDGVPVKYLALSREISLRGVIKGTGYLCECSDCKSSKVVNAYEFERHAGCKTKHPNNHIYFENGKTIYSVVQELKNTPQELLFDVVQNITGSPINQKNYRNWKVSYEAAIRELKRIYGKDNNTVVPS